MIRSIVTLICLGILTLQGAFPAEAARATFTMTIATGQNIINPGSEVALDVDLVNVSDEPIELTRVRSGGSLYRCTPPADSLRFSGRSLQLLCLNHL